VLFIGTFEASKSRASAVDASKAVSYEIHVAAAAIKTFHMFLLDFSIIFGKRSDDL